LLPDPFRELMRSGGLFVATSGFAVMSGLVVWMVAVGPEWQRVGGRAGFNVPDYRFVPG
jgi:hypothetical protein